MAASKEIPFKKLFRVYVGDQIPNDPTMPSVAGKYEIAGSTMIFNPRFDPPPGVTYTMVFEVSEAYSLIAQSRPNGLPNSVQETFQFPTLQPIYGKAIGAIYPLADVLPANLLRMYVYFNQPMGLTNPHDHVWLINEAGERINTPFVEITEGLWNANRTRLTLFFHPGRVKRGVGPNLTMGAVLEPGNSYQLSFDPEWKDALGRAIGETSPKSFRVSEADRNRINPQNWTIQAPMSGSIEPIQINWSKPLDYALAKRMISVIHENQDVPVIAELFDHERQLQLIPSSEWSAGKYFLEIDPRLEDLAGNTAFHLFDTATSSMEDPKGRDVAPMRIPFEIE
ncbi:MAG: hypothetical protein R8G66_08855 [Cytophagales bacterium]|nr:hypothetical protein [Cytophagales bacterium]